MTDPIIIIGMPRSGSTYLAGKINEAGVKMWDWDMGHHEDAEIWGLNSAELASNPVGMNAIPYAYEPSEIFLQKLKEYGERRGEIWGFKDPRMDKLLQAYFKVWPKATYICCIRNTLSMALSQNARPNINKLVEVPKLTGNYAFRISQICVQFLEAGIPLHWFNYDGDMEATQRYFDETLHIPVDFSDFKHKAPAIEGYTSDDPFNVIVVERDLDIEL